MLKLGYKGNEENEESPYGPWLLASYGKQGNRNFNGRTRKYRSGNGRTVAKIGFEGKAYAARNNLDSKADRNSSVRTPEGECSEVRNGNKTQVRYGRPVKNSEGIRITDSGSRFDVLNMEMDSPRTEVTTSVGIPNEGTRLKGKTVLSEITNMNGSQSGKYGKGGKKSSRKNNAEIVAVEANSSRMAESISIQDNLNNQTIPCSSKMSHETAQSQFTIDPYQFLRIIPNPDGSITHNEIFCPRTPATPNHPPHDDYILPVLSKDVFINQSNDSWVRLFLTGGRVRAPLDSSSSDKLPLIVYFHGEGFILNTPDMMFFHKFCSDMVVKLQAVVVSVKHRLAPEHRLPAAYDDAMEALHWIKTTHEVWLQKYVDFSKCFLIGNSSGGNVADHAALHAAAEADDLQPLQIKGLILHQPFFGRVKRTCSELSLFTNKIFPVCVSDLMWDLSLPIRADRDHEYCNPTVDGG
ncbi:hypothetical protein EZV62_028312 [Acer yangbiense]|uniref:Alpha/beta hydrolase fold-3 domain-containing protein n=1 Tax=Acer yangbiense TaxID=1000413 RepID=A0A5C7GN06_9ROSI|nr:hypothetical protein EZV62_028312 [Acer yangbiense]